MFSVVMPAYNGADYIGDAIESVLNQTYTAFELIVINDGSLDNTSEIVKHYAAHDSRVCLIEENHNGVAAARNVGLRIGHYPWIALLDSDDIALPQRLERQVEAIQSDSEVVVWTTATQIMSECGQIYNEIRPGGPECKEAFYRQRKTGKVIYLATTAAVFRKDIALLIGGFDPRFEPADDTEFWDRMAAYGPTLALPEALTLYRLHRKSTMARRFSLLYRHTQFLEARAKARAKGKELDFERFSQDFTGQMGLKRLLSNADMRSQLHYRNAGTYISAKQYAPGLFQLGLAFVFNPRLIVGRISRRLMVKRTP